MKPNHFGQFDMLGNALEWCQESVAHYTPGEAGKAAADVEDLRDITETLPRVLRGGSFSYVASSVRSADRNRVVPTSRSNLAGFRPARTFR
jgi:formylglycine-generating enzyme required for sulfatase activity